jgi:hypothetical protein
LKELAPALRVIGDRIIYEAIELERIYELAAVILSRIQREMGGKQRLHLVATGGELGEFPTLAVPMAVSLFLRRIFYDMNFDDYRPASRCAISAGMESTTGNLLGNTKTEAANLNRRPTVVKTHLKNILPFDLFFERTVPVLASYG